MRRPYVKRPKPKPYAQTYIENGFNGTETIRKLKPHLTKLSAAREASDLMALPEYKNAVLEELAAAGITKKEAAIEHAKVIKQNEHYPAKNTALDMFYKLEGDYAPDKNVQWNINIPQNLPEAINELIKEAQQLLRNKEKISENT